MEDLRDYESVPVVTLCGSTRFKDEFIKQNRLYTLLGYAVFSVGVFGHATGEFIPTGEKEQLDHLHKCKILLSSSILVINVDGYIGESTASEIQFAYEQNVSIHFLEPESGMRWLEDNIDLVVIK